MPLPRNPGAYIDVDRLLRGAVAAGGAVVKFETAQQAIRWVQRAYSYRKLLLELDANSPGVAVGARLARTPYDAMTLHRDGATVDIRFGAGQNIVSMKTPDGKPLALPTDDEAADDEDAYDEDTIAQARKAIMDLKTDG